jgi:hypothetical protein
MLHTRAWPAAVLLGLAIPAGTAAQEPVAPTPVIDSVAIVVHNVFTEQEAARSFVFRLMNSVRVSTREHVVERELLFEQGEPYDSARSEETERNLRALRLFREVSVDTVRLDGRLVARVNTRDAWSTRAILHFSGATDGTWTGKFGVRETNLLGTGNLVHAAYRKEVDRDGLELQGQINRFITSQIDAGGFYFGLSDGKSGSWWGGDTWKSFDDRRYAVYRGEAAARRILRYRIPDAANPDTTFYWRRALVNRLTGAIATMASPAAYLRIGVLAEVRDEEYMLLRDTAQIIPDTVKAFVGVFGEYRRARFQIFRYLNGFAEEDIDLSPRVTVRFNFAPAGFGYESTGVGPGVVLAAGAPVGRGFVHGSVGASGLFNGAGLDSGRVVVRVTAAQKPAARHATIVHLQAGIIENPPPGGEFDLGFSVPPRSFEPHSFVGTHMVWGTAEHRWYALNGIFDVLGLGLAAFIDYGGAWYTDQDARRGGNVGIGLRTGRRLGSVANTGRFDLGYRFGEDVVGNRWVLSVGTGFAFP